MSVLKLNATTYYLFFGGNSCLNPLRGTLWYTILEMERLAGNVFQLGILQCIRLITGAKILGTESRLELTREIMDCLKKFYMTPTLRLQDTWGRIAGPKMWSNIIVRFLKPCFTWEIS